MGRLLTLLPILVAVAALGDAAGDWTLAAAIGGIATVLAIVGPRFDVDRGRRLLTAAVGAGAGYAVVDLLYDPHKGSLGEGWTRVAAAAILAAAARFLLVAIQGRLVTAALVFVGLLAAGQTHVGGYAGFVALFLAASVWAPVVYDEHVLVKKTSLARLAAGGAVLLASAVLAAGVTFGAQSAYRWMTNRQRMIALNWSPPVGFSDRIDLGGLDELLDSETIVLRVRGPRVDYLRGAVLDLYAGGRWMRSDDVATEKTVAFDDPWTPDDGVKIIAVSENTGRFFLPLAARAIAVTPSSVKVDAAGSVKRIGDRGLETARFALGPRDKAAPAAPGAADLQIPRSVRSSVEELAARWTAGATTPDAKLDAIERHFDAEFRYARAVPTLSGPDPVLDFLLVHKSGHCEYFATGMVLLARAAGIPARFVAGYRVAERTPFGYYVVRERNAHAWVETWMPDRGWTTRDPTPEIDLPQNLEHDSGYLASLSDGLRVAWEGLDDWLQRRTLEQTTVAWVIGFAVLVWIIARGVRRRGVADPGVRDDEAALPCLETMLAALARAGVAHDGYEPIERLAARAPHPDAARLLERYAALRYGGIGDPDALAGDMTAYARGFTPAGSADDDTRGALRPRR
jgi:transglutaminase-like putative cysteine protease